MLVGVDRLLGFGGVFFLGIIGMSVGVAIFFIGTSVFLAAVLSLDSNFR